MLKNMDSLMANRVTGIPARPASTQVCQAKLLEVSRGTVNAALGGGLGEV